MNIKFLLVIFVIFFLTVSLSGCEEHADEQTTNNGEEWHPEDGSQDLSGGEWETEKMIFEGSYCDAEIMAIPTGGYRIYYCVEPEVEDANSEMYSAISVDGLNWIQDDDIRMSHTTFPDVVRLTDGSYRMYHQGNEGSTDPDIKPKMGTKSSASIDGLVWTEEYGMRITAGLQGTYDAEYASDTSTVIRPDGTYFMVYRGESGERKDQIDDIKGTPLETFYLISATSEDGLTWTAGSLVLDTSKEEFSYYVLGPELVYDDNVLKLYFFGYSGIYEKVSYDDGETWEEERIVFPGNRDFAPSDPTVIKQDDTWRMYYGIHETGIYSAIKTE